jgi:hypothetical protein
MTEKDTDNNIYLLKLLKTEDILEEHKYKYKIGDKILCFVIEEGENGTNYAPIKYLDNRDAFGDIFVNYKNKTGIKQEIKVLKKFKKIDQYIEYTDF